MTNRMADRAREPQSFEEFWPYYLGEHAQSATRQMHIAGTGVAIASLAAFAITRRPAYLAAALAGSYGPAWLAHAAIEGNKPATFEYPLWSLLADLKMFSLWTRGELGDEVARCHALGERGTRQTPAVCDSRKQPRNHDCPGAALAF